ncbi:MAG: S8 family peptidase [Patescibacteria group bacterium]
MLSNGNWYDRHRRKLSKRLYAQLCKESPEDPLPVIIMFGEDVAPDDGELRKRVHYFGSEIERELPIIRAFATSLSGRHLSEIGPHDKVRKVHLDRRLHPCLDIGVPAIYADRAQADGYTGRGITIAVLDSGIYPHADFMRPRPRIVAWHDEVDGRPKPYDDHGHGTHVAGIAAGNGYASGGKYRGTAPEAGIVAIKVADAEGEAPMSRVIAGLQWVLDNRERYGIRVVNLSLGADPSESYREDPLCQAVEQLWKAGIVVVAAAGNDGPEAGSIDTPGNDPLIITVGAMDDRQTVTRQDDLIPRFSSRGPTNDGLRKPDLMAPGVSIIAPQTGGGYISRSGTSMSTPFVAGASALLLGKDPGLTPNEVKRALRISAESRDLAVRTGGAGYLDVRRLLDLPPAKAEAKTPSRTAAPAKTGTTKATEAARALVRQELKGRLRGLAQQLLRIPLFLHMLAVLL